MLVKSAARRRVGIALVVGLAAAIAVAGWVVIVRSSSTTVHSEFAYVNGVFPGTEVTVLGVPVGTVEAVEPRGSTVMVTMSVAADVSLSAEVNSYVLVSSAIGERFVELGPAYTGGPMLADGDTIPPERSHSPITWDRLMDSVDTVVEALGPEGGNVGAALSATAASTQGMGQAMNDAIRNLSQASSVVAGNSEDIGALIDNLEVLVATISARQAQVDSLAQSLTAVGDEFAGQKFEIGSTIGQLTTLLNQIDQLVAARGGDLGASIDNLAGMSGVLREHDTDLAEIMDLLPLLIDNIQRAVTPDQRARIRLNISTNLAQAEPTSPLCSVVDPILCRGPGVTNPIQFPPSMSDPFGLAELMVGGR
ncbi:MCE family protein [Rhodococcus tibetensis]|uniref:MCE family protein n=1 Tax=Rhodococcus tibetensis TaxID=2965064 RepID=A0ABT1QGD7_9NOCA|nr:MCE family protein [Rhodococcus sp. FXJ9.536]MCQ4120177.1 MCE family protein [Rhodococcus sp. FXJ9.536]